MRRALIAVGAYIALAAGGYGVVLAFTASSDAEAVHGVVVFFLGCFALRFMVNLHEDEERRRGL